MIGRSQDQYTKLFLSLVPNGKIWNKNDDSELTKFLKGLAVEFTRIEKRGFDLFNESIPSKISELLEEYEQEYGLYEENIELGKTTEERVASIVAKFLEYGGTHKAYFEDILDALGYTITIEEFTPFWSGVGAAGNPCGGLVNLFWWKVLITVEADINYNIEQLMHEIIKYKPSHTIVLFDFYGRGFSRGFNCGFDSMPDFDNSWGDNSYGKIGDKELGFSAGFSNGFANAYDYDGINLVGGFGYGFSIGFDRYSGGSFRKAFSDGFSRPH